MGTARLTHLTGAFSKIHGLVRPGYLATQVLQPYGRVGQMGNVSQKGSHQTSIEENMCVRGDTTYTPEDSRLP